MQAPPFIEEPITVAEESAIEQRENNDKLSIEKPAADAVHKTEDDAPSRLTMKKEKRKTNEALRFFKYGIVKRPLGGRRFSYTMGNATVTSLKAAMRLCTAAEKQQH